MLRAGTTPSGTLPLRLVLAAGFVSAVADRFGAWGDRGASNVAWGAWEPFVTYTGQLNPWLPLPLAEPLAVLVTALELALAGLLVSGLWGRMTAMLTSTLLWTFAATMAFVLGPKAPLDYGVFVAAAGAWLLAAQPRTSDSLERSHD